MATPTNFARRLKFLGKRISESGADLIEEANRQYRDLAVKTLEKHKALTPVQEARPDRAPSTTPLREGWRLRESGDIKSDQYTVAVVNVHDRPLPNKNGKIYRKANGQFFTLLDALDVGTDPHKITTEGAFFFWWEKEQRYFEGRKNKTVINHPGTKARGVLTVPRTWAAREAKNLRRRILRKAARGGR